MKSFVIIPVLWAVFIGIIVNVYAIESHTKIAKQKFAASIKAKPFPLSQVTLLDSPFKDAMDRTCSYLRFLDADRMLYSFRSNYGLSTQGAQAPGGWEATDCKLRGHSMGHFLVALAQAYASTGDEQYKTKAEYIIDELEKCQNEATNQGYNAGFLSAYGEYQFEELEQLQTYPNIWAPYYTQHKIFSGLIACYNQLGSTKALDIVKKMGDWVYNRLSTVDPVQLQRMWDLYIAGEYGGMNDVLAELHEITQEEKYTTTAKYFDHNKIFTPCAANQDRLSGNHANQTIPKITGALRVYEQTNEQEYYDIAANFWNMVTGHHMYVIGGTSDGEMFKDPDKIGAHITEKTCETCCTHNMLKLTKQLFMHDPNAQYMDYYERALYNHILASQDARSNHGFTTYFVPLNAGGRKSYSNDYYSFTCCHGTGMENHTKYAESIYFHSDSTLWVNLFIPSELNWQEKGFVIRQETAFPEEQKTNLIVNGSGNLAIKIRRPFWAKHGFTVKINDVVQPISVNPGSYFTLDRFWADGDRISIEMPFAFRIEYTPDINDLGSVMYGPVLLGGENQTSMETLQLDPTNPGSSFTPDNNDPLHFTSNNISFVPFYKIHGISYCVYFKTDPMVDINDNDFYSSNDEKFFIGLNQFVNQAVVSYSIIKPSKVCIQIYSINGQLISTLFNGFQQSGRHSCNWRLYSDRGEMLSNSMYIVKLTTDTKTYTNKLLVAH